MSSPRHSPYQSPERSYSRSSPWHGTVRLSARFLLFLSFQFLFFFLHFIVAAQQPPTLWPCAQAFPGGSRLVLTRQSINQSPVCLCTSSFLFVLPFFFFSFSFFCFFLHSPAPLLSPVLSLISSLTTREVEEMQHAERERGGERRGERERCDDDEKNR